MHACVIGRRRNFTYIYIYIDSDLISGGRAEGDDLEKRSRETEKCRKLGRRGVISKAVRF